MHKLWPAVLQREGYDLCEADQHEQEVLRASAFVMYAIPNSLLGLSTDGGLTVGFVVADAYLRLFEWGKCHQCMCEDSAP